MNKKLADLLKSKVLANSAWLIVLQVFNTIVPLLTLPYITRVLGTSNYGVFSLALNWVTYFQVDVYKRQIQMLWCTKLTPMTRIRIKRLRISRQTRATG